MVAQRPPKAASESIWERRGCFVFTFLGIPEPLTNGLSKTHTFAFYIETGQNSSALSVLKAETNLNVCLGILT